MRMDYVPDLKAAIVISHMSRMAMLLSSQYVFRKPYLAGRGQLKDIKT